MQAAVSVGEIVPVPICGILGRDGEMCFIQVKAWRCNACIFHPLARICLPGVVM